MFAANSALNPSLNRAIARLWDGLARTGHSQKFGKDLLFYSSSSGGGLPGRPMTRKSRTPVLFAGNLSQSGDAFKALATVASAQ